MPPTPAQKSLRGKKGAYTSWANTTDRPARTRNAREAFEKRFLTKADGDPQRAEAMRKAVYADLALKSAQARARRKGAA